MSKIHIMSTWTTIVTQMVQINRTRQLAMEDYEEQE